MKTVCAKEYVDAINTTVNELKEKYISKIFMEKKFTFTTKSVGAQSSFRVMNGYDIHVDGYKPLAFAEVYFSGYCTMLDHYWDKNEKAKFWAFNLGGDKDINTEIFILYVKDTFI